MEARGIWRALRAASGAKPARSEAKPSGAHVLGSPSVTEQAAEPRDSADVQVIAQDGREILLVGTAHVSRESAELVRELIEKERPDRVCIELDAQRYEALTQRRR